NRGSLALVGVEPSRAGGSLRRAGSLVVPHGSLPQLRERLDFRIRRLPARPARPAGGRKRPHLLLPPAGRRGPPYLRIHELTGSRRSGESLRPAARRPPDGDGGPPSIRRFPRSCRSVRPRGDRPTRSRSFDSSTCTAARWSRIESRSGSNTST